MGCEYCSLLSRVRVHTHTHTHTGHETSAKKTWGAHKIFPSKMDFAHISY